MTESGLNVLTFPPMYINFILGSKIIVLAKPVCVMLKNQSLALTLNTTSKSYRLVTCGHLCTARSNNSCLVNSTSILPLNWTTYRISELKKNQRIRIRAEYLFRNYCYLSTNLFKLLGWQGGVWNCTFSFNTKMAAKRLHLIEILSLFS